MARNITVIPAKQILTAESGTAQSVQKLKMAAYCRVSTDQEEQLLSYENQVNYYTNYISENPLMNMQELMRMRKFRELTQRRGMNLTA